MDIFTGPPITDPASAIASTTSLIQPGGGGMSYNTGLMAMAGMSAVGGGISAFGQYKAGQMQKTAYDYNAAVDIQNMQEEEQASEAKFSSLMGKQASLYAKAGVDISSGSPLLIRAWTAATGTEEQGRIQEAGTERATLERFYGEEAEAGADVSAFSTFLSGLGKAGIGYIQATNKGPYVPTYA